MEFSFGGSAVVDFTPVSITISAPIAVPEPATYATFVGALAFTAVVWRRRRATAA